MPNRMKLTLPRSQKKTHDIFSNVVVERTGTIYNAGTNTLEINDVIDDWFGVSSLEVSEALKDMDESQPLTVRINSPGGMVYEALAIHNMIAEWPQQVTTHVVSLAASAATVIAMVGDTRTMSDNAEFMVHNPWTFTWGNSNELRTTAKHLDRVAENLLDMYERKSNLSRQKIKDLLNGPEHDDGTFMTAKEALEAGFITQIIDTSRTPESLDNHCHRRTLAKIKLA